MYAGAIIVPLIVGGALGLTTGADVSHRHRPACMRGRYLLAGIRQQVLRHRPAGHARCAFQAVGPMIIIGQQHGMSAIYGAIIASGLFVILFSGLFGKLIKVFPPVVTGSVVTIIGLTLIPVALTDLGGGQSAGMSLADALNISLGFGVLAFIIIMNRFAKGFLRSISVLLGLILGTVVAAFYGGVDLTPLREAGWFRAPRPFFWHAGV